MTPIEAAEREADVLIHQATELRIPAGRRRGRLSPRVRQGSDGGGQHAQGDRASTRVAGSAEAGRDRNMKAKVEDLSDADWEPRTSMEMTVAAIEVRDDGRAVALMMGDRMFTLRNRAEVALLIKLIHESEAIAWPRGTA
jgi:hypothetical protein